MYAGNLIWRKCKSSKEDNCFSTIPPWYLLIISMLSLVLPCFCSWLRWCITAIVDLSQIRIHPKWFNYRGKPKIRPFLRLKLIYLTRYTKLKSWRPAEAVFTSNWWLFTQIKKLDVGTASLRARFLIYMIQNESKSFLGYCGPKLLFLIEAYACFIFVWDKTSKFHIITSI